MSDAHRDRIMKAIGKFYARTEKDRDSMQEAWKSSGPKKRRRAKSNIPTEREEQVKLAKYLDSLGLLWCHVPNEGHGGYGKGAQIKGARLRAEGLKSGVPDVLIFNQCSVVSDKEDVHRAGCAIELKREKGGRVSEAQKEWLEGLRRAGWVAEVCNGFDEAQKLIRELGYEGKSKQRCEASAEVHGEKEKESK